MKKLDNNIMTWVIYNVDVNLNIEDIWISLEESKIENIILYEDIEYEDEEKEEISYSTYCSSINILKKYYCLIYSKYKIKEGDINIKLIEINEKIDYEKVLNRVISNSKIEKYIKGFSFAIKENELKKYILNSKSKQDFNSKSFESGLPEYTINNLFKIWEYNKRNIYLNSIKINIKELNDINSEHLLIKEIEKFLSNSLKSNTDRFKVMIIIGSTQIGKSVLFENFICDKKLIDYHSNLLEFAYTDNQFNKIIRVLDDINWNEVDEFTMKALLNRNLATVNVKYGYEYIFPLIPFILLNKENYKSFQKKFENIWTFINDNSIIYPNQKPNEKIRNELTNEIKEEEIKLYTKSKLDLNDLHSRYILNSIIPYEELINIILSIESNLINTIKQWLIKFKGDEYNINKYIQFPNSITKIYIPNPYVLKTTLEQQVEDIKLLEWKDVLINKKEDYKRKRNFEDISSSSSSINEEINYKNKKSIDYNSEIEHINSQTYESEEITVY